MRIRSVWQVLAIIVVGLAALSSKSHALPVTFEGGTLVGNVYTENGLQFALFGDVHFTPFNGGTALTIGTAADVIITRVGGGPFSLDSLVTLGPNFTGLFGWVQASDFHTGGNNSGGTTGPLADVSIDLSAINPTPIFPVALDPRWGNIEVIDFCGYCVTAFGAAGGIDDLNFSIRSSVPAPGTLLLFAAGAVMLAARRMRNAVAAVS